MLIACQDCHRQYDVEDLAVGSKIRCNCGELVEVVEIEPREMEMLKCSSCGGTLEKDASECGFCGSEAALGDRGYGGVCPECYSRMAKGARFCCTCGVGIAPVASLSPLNDKLCPRCDGLLAVQEFEGGSLVDCTVCGGIWLDSEEFKRVSQETEKDAVSKYVRARKESTGQADVEREKSVRYLKCPTCGEYMHRKNFAYASGVIIDWCRAHGYWFDRNELEAILGFIRDGGLEVARDKEVERQKSEARLARTRLRAAPADYGGLGYRDRRRDDRSDDLLDTLRGFLGRFFS